MIELYAYQLEPGTRVRFVNTSYTVKSIKGTYVSGHGLLVDINFESELGVCSSILMPPTKIVNVVEVPILP